MPLRELRRGHSVPLLGPGIRELTGANDSRKLGSSGPPGAAWVKVDVNGCENDIVLYMTAKRLKTGIRINRVSTRTINVPIVHPIRSQIGSNFGSDYTYMVVA